MHYVDLVLAVIAVSCLNLIWVKGEIFSSFKQFLIDTSGRFDAFVAYVTSCSMCSGVWFGLGSYVFIQPYLLGKPWWMEIFLWTGLVAITSIAMDKHIWKPKPADVIMNLPAAANVQHYGDVRVQD